MTTTNLPTWRNGVDEIHGEMNKIKSPTLDGEHKKDEYVETWLLGMRKYFQLHNYSTRERDNFHLLAKRKGINVVG
jgi:hypothetical protein